MLHIAVKLTPPPKGSLAGKMHPKDFLLSSPVKRKLKDVIEFSPKRVRLDPTPHHATLESYHTDTSIKMGNDRRKLQTLIPFNEQLRILKADIRDMRKELDDVKSELNDVKSELNDVKSELKDSRMERLRLYAGNLLISLGKIAFPKFASDASTHRLQQRLGMKSVETELAAADIPCKYWPFLKNISKYTEQRNAAAHSTGNEFASLLLSLKETHPQAYHQWAEASPIVYGGTIEELGERNRSIDDDILGLVVRDN